MRNEGEVELVMGHRFTAVKCEDCGMEMVGLSIIRGKDEWGNETVSFLTIGGRGFCMFCGKKLLRGE